MPPLIAVAEDSAEDFELIRLGLERDAPQVEILRFDYGDRALRYLTDGAARAPDLVLLDLNLPVKDGFEVLAALGEHPDSRTPVVVLTTSSRDRDRQRAAELGARDYIVKSMDFDEFVETVADAKKRWLR